MPVRGPQAAHGGKVLGLSHEGGAGADAAAVPAAAAAEENAVVKVEVKESFKK